MRGIIVLVVSAAAVSVVPQIAGASAHTSSAPPACPATQPVSTFVSERPGAADELVPPGATALRLCSYQSPSSVSTSSSVNGDDKPVDTPRALRRSVVASRWELRWFVRTLNALSPYRAGKAIACPADLGTKDLALFAYAASPGNAVTIDLTGCTPAGNGQVTRWASSVILDELARLLG